MKGFLIIIVLLFSLGPRALSAEPEDITQTCDLLAKEEQISQEDYKEYMTVCIEDMSSTSEPEAKETEDQDVGTPEPAEVVEPDENSGSKIFNWFD